MKTFFFKFIVALIAVLSSINVKSQTGEDCSSAIQLSSEGCSAAGEYNNAGIEGTLSIGTAPGDCFADGGSNNGMWFKFIASSPTVNVNINGGSIATTMMKLLSPFSQSNACGGGSFTQLGCNSPGTQNSGITYSSLINGNTYFLYVDGGTSSTGTFQICLSSPAQPVNDNICNAITLPASNFCSPASAYTNVGSTPEAIMSSLIPGCFGPSGNVINGVWFQYTALGSANTITVNGGTLGLQNPQVAIIVPAGNDCNATSFVTSGCATGASGSNTVTVDVNNLTAGLTYYIIVDGYNINTGTFQICVNSYTPTSTVQNDECSNALLLCPNNQYFGTTGGATPNSAVDPYIAPGGTPSLWSCNAIIDNDIWYKFTATDPVQDINFTINSQCFPKPSSGYNGISNAYGGAFQFEVFEATTEPCTDNMGWSSIACKTIGNATYATGGQSSRILNIPASSLTAGKTYYLIIDNYPKCWCDFDFTITGNLGTNAGTDQTVCLNSSSFSLTGQSPLGGTWSGPGVTSVGVFNPDLAGRGTHTLYYSQGACTDSKTITVSSPIVNVSNDVTICEGKNTTLFGDTVSSPKNYPATFSNNTASPIPDAINSTTQGVLNSTITVSGVTPDLISQSAILSVCLNITHPSIGDLKVQLKCPDGNTITLVNKRGSTGDNMTNTCFVAVGPSVSSGAAPFSGNYKPESAFTNLNTCVVNGIWTLIVKDYNNTEVGTLQDWSISFNNTNYITSFYWSPTTNMIDENTLFPTVTPASTTTYTLSAMDVFGCTDFKQVTVNVTPAPQPPVAVNNSRCGEGTVSLAVSGISGTISWYADAEGDSVVAIGETFTTATLAQTTTYYVSSTVGGCESSKTSVTATINPMPNVSINKTDVTCNGACDGMATAIVTGGTPAYSYLWSNSLTGQNVNSLCPGAISVTVTDLNSCTATASETIVEPDVLSVTGTFVSPSCNGVCNGSLTANNATGGMAPYSYSWSNSLGTEQNIINICAGMQAVTVTDSNLCAANAIINVTEPEPIAISVTPADPEICAGNQVVLTASGASAYSWSPATGLNQDTGNVVNSNPAVTTTYDIIGITAAGCKGVATATITVHPIPVISITPANPTICKGGCITLTATGAPSIQWTPATALSPGTNFSTVTSCPSSTITYTAFGTNSEGCVGSNTNTVTVIDLPVVSVSPSSSSICPGDSAVLQASGATTYEWSLGGNPVGFGSSFTVSPQVTTTYTVTGLLSDGCSDQTTLTITVDPLPSVSVIASTSEICSGESANLTANGATSYNWFFNGQLIGTYQAISVSPDSTGNYTVEGTNEYGCKNNTLNTIIVNPLPVIEVSSAEICIGQNTALTASGASTYTWEDPQVNTLNSNVGQTVTAFPISTNTYTVTGTNSNNCSNNAEVTVTVNNLPSIMITSPEGICKGQSATLSASGANLYTWSPAIDLTTSSGSTVTASPSVVGNHTYTVTGIDATTGCSNNAVKTFMVYGLPLVNIILSDDNICFGETVTMIADAPTATQYFWDSEAIGGLHGPYDVSTATATPDLSSTGQYIVKYQLMVADENGCLDSASKSLLVNPNPQILIASPPDSICIGESVLLSASGAVSYLWTPNIYLNIDNAPAVTSTPIVSNTGAFQLTYQVTGTSSEGCSGSMAVSFFVRSDIILTLPFPGNSICEGMESNIAISATGGMPPYVYAWENSAGNTSYIQSPGNSSSIVFPPATETFTVTVRDACTTPGQEENVTIVVNPAPTADFDPFSGCAPMAGTFFSSSDIQGSCTWEFGDGTYAINDCSPTKVYPEAGNYSVTLTVIDTGYSTRCQGSIIKEIKVFEQPTALFTFSPETAKDYNPVINFNSSDSYSNIKAFMWDFAGFENDTLPFSQPLTSFAFPDSGHFPVQLIVEDENGCLDTLIQVVVIEPDWGIYVPSAFTPTNNDGLNDFFSPKGYGITEYELAIFNRWGSMIFSTGIVYDPIGNNLPGWNGIPEGSSEIAQLDVYVYMIQGKTILGDSFNRKGHVTLLR